MTTPRDLDRAVEEARETLFSWLGESPTGVTQVRALQEYESAIAARACAPLEARIKELEAELANR